MDNSLSFIFLLILGFFILFFKYNLVPKIKGDFGESLVSNILKKLNGEEYTLLNNVKLNINGSTSQIDHIVVSNYGIFVIETKNYKGWILGYEKNKYWTQVIYRYKRKFYNPILQNQGHIYSLKYFLKQYKYVNYISIIVFTEKSTLKTKTYTDVIHTNDLISTIRRYNQKKINDEIKNKITEEILLAKKVKKYQIKPTSKNNKTNTKCPKCGGKLIERKGKYGKFIGCKNFPNCKFTANAN